MPAEPDSALPCHPKDVTAGWLTARLRKSGALPSGAAASVTVDLAEKWHMAQSARLAIDYDTGAPADAPRRLFMKVAENEDPFADIAAGEFAFYSEKAAPGLPILRCYDLARDPSTGVSHLLLEDLSESHEQTRWPLPPPLAHCEAAVTALARLHAHWWTTGTAPSGALHATLRRRHERFAGHIADLLPPFLDALGETLPPARQAMMRAVIARLPDLIWARLTGGQAITLAHGDPHFWNVMYPKDPARHDCVFVDWEDWYHGAGAFDLAYMIALHWFPERRARQEQHLLRCYHEALSHEISVRYEWDELQTDYRLGHLHNFVVPLFQQNMGITPGVWWPHLERLFLGYEDLDCAALL